MVECTVAIGVTRVRFPTGVFFLFDLGVQRIAPRVDGSYT